MLKVNKENIEIKKEQLPVVNFTWKIENISDQKLSQKVIPQFCFDIIVPIGGELFVNGESVSIPFISPILTKPKEVVFNPGITVIGYRLNPFYAGLVFKKDVEVCDLLEKPNLLADFIHPIINKSIQKLEVNNGTEIGERLLRSSQDILNTSKPSEVSRVHRLNQIILTYKKRPEIRVSELSDLFGMSARNLEIEFKRNFGHSPKKIFQIIRLNNVLGELDQTKNLTELAYKVGYYDQSHFIRESKSITEETPKRLKRIYSDFYEIMNGEI